MKIVYFSSSDIGAEILDFIINNSSHEIVVYSRNDKVRNRGKKILPTSVKTTALQHDLIVKTADRYDEIDIEFLKTFDPDIFILFSYGVIFNKELLDLPKYSCLNIHTSLLPNLRGASPIETAILKDFEISGISYMKMDEGLDTGDVYEMHKIDISDLRYIDFKNKIIDTIKSTILPLLDKIEKNTIVPNKQTGESSYAKKIKKDDLQIDFSNDAKMVYNKIRAFDDHLGAYTIISGIRYKLYDAELCEKQITPGNIEFGKDYMLIGAKNKSIKIKSIQMEGKKKMKVSEFLNGRSLPPKVDNIDG